MVIQMFWPSLPAVLIPLPLQVYMPDLIPPHSTQPGFVSGSLESFRYNSALYIIIDVSVTEPRNWPTSPAEWKC